MHRRISCTDDYPANAGFQILAHDNIVGISM